MSGIQQGSRKFQLYFELLFFLNFERLIFSSINLLDLLEMLIFNFEVITLADSCFPFLFDGFLGTAILSADTALLTSDQRLNLFDVDFFLNPSFVFAQVLSNC